MLHELCTAKYAAPGEREEIRHEELRAAYLQPAVEGFIAGLRLQVTTASGCLHVHVSLSVGDQCPHQCHKRSARTWHAVSTSQTLMSDPHPVTWLG